MKLRRNQNGLTLIEALVSVVIAGISLTALVIPMTSAALLQKQEKALDEASNLARLQMESIRSQWSTAAGYYAGSTITNNNGTAVTVSVDPTSWPNTANAVNITMLNSAGTSLSSLSDNVVTIQPTITSTTTPTISATVTSTCIAAANCAAADLTGYAFIRGINFPIPRATSGLSRDYIGQMIVGATPNVTGDKARRVAIRIFAANNNAGTLTIASTTAARTKSLSTTDGNTVNTSMNTGALAILVTDIAGPPQL
jgi:type II secretory pathway pseudopilin PulG